MAKRPTPQELYKQVIELRANKQPVYSEKFREIMHELLDIMLDAGELSYETTLLNSLIQSAPYTSIDDTPVVLALGIGPPAMILNYTVQGVTHHNAASAREYERAEARRLKAQGKSNPIVVPGSDNIQ